MCEASVAVILSRGKVLLVRRRPRKGDKFFWQVGFPGGRVKRGESCFEAAVREVEEEVGINLGENELTGELPLMSTLTTRVAVKPLLFHLDDEVEPKIDEREIEEARWVRLSPRRSLAYIPGRGVLTPAFIMDGLVVWGLTYRVLSLLFHRIGDVHDSAGS